MVCKANEMAGSLADSCVGKRVFQGTAMSRMGWRGFVHPISRYFRQRRAATLHSLFPQLSSYRVIDVGGSRHYWEKVDLPVAPGQLTILNVADAGSTESWSGVYGGVAVRIYDGHSIPFEDKSFDLAVCNSVIEHVPVAQRAHFIGELRRVAKRVYLQTPAMEFPIEPHFVVPVAHWLPRKIGYFVARMGLWRLLSRPSKEAFDRYWNETQLLSRKELKKLAPGWSSHDEVVLGLTKSYVVVGPD